MGLPFYPKRMYKAIMMKTNTFIKNLKSLSVLFEAGSGEYPVLPFRGSGVV